MPQVITFGETMVSFIPNAAGPLRYADHFIKRAAGSESNFAIGLTRLGKECGWIGKLGRDEFGLFVLQQLRGEGVDVSRAVFHGKAPTGIMFKEMSYGLGTRIYYYRDHSAACCLEPGDLDEEYIRTADLLYLTGITAALGESCLETVRHAIRIAKKYKIKICFDPNIRLKLWSREQAAATLREFLPDCDIFLSGLCEAQMILGLPQADGKRWDGKRWDKAYPDGARPDESQSDQAPPGEILDRLLHLGIPMIALKAGRAGAWVADRDARQFIEAFPAAEVEPVGAGDAFNAGFVCGVLEGLPLTECGRLGCAMGGFAVSTAGDYEGLPDRERLECFIRGKEDILR